MFEAKPVRIADIRATGGFRASRQAAAETAASPVAEPETSVSLFDEGYRQGQRDAEQSFIAERARFQDLIASCEAIQPEPSELLGLLIAESVEMIVRATVGEVPIDAETLLGRARCAASLVADADGDRLMRLHPDDVALLAGTSLPLAVTADASVTRGSLRIEHASGWIEDGIAVRLDALRAQLGLKDLAA